MYYYLKQCRGENRNNYRRICHLHLMTCNTSKLQLYVKCKVFYGQEPPSGESTTTECGFNYHLLSVIY